jgi:hypothetical protein
MDKETFAPHVISFLAHEYEAMVRTFKLPFRAIEGTSLVGPFFWSAYDQDVEDPRLRQLPSPHEQLAGSFLRLELLTGI